MSTRRLVLLARAGQARERVQAGLADAGAELAGVFEPGAIEPSELLAQARQAGALLVMLESSVEPALEQYEAVFAERTIDVVFDDADVAVRREGWEAARWARHLAAKLHGHDDVLPQGAGSDDADAVHAEPPPAAGVPDWLAETPATAELAAEVGPADTPAPAPEAQADAQVPDAAPDWPVIAGLETVAVEPRASAQPVFDDPVSAAAGWSTGDEGDAPVAVPEVAPEPVVPDWSTGGEGDAPVAAAVPEVAPEPVVPDWSTSGEGDAPAIVASDSLEVMPEPVVPDWSTSGEGDAPVAAAPAAAAQLVPAAPAWSLSDMSEEPVAMPAGSRAELAQDTAARHDLAELERRVAGMSLAEQAPVGTAQGAVLVLAGLGGPDALRQLLGALPDAFARPVLVCQQLDGNHHGKLVKQLQRATALPVTLAEIGEAVEPGHVYVLADGIGLQAGAQAFSYDADAGAAGILAALRADDSAVLLLSGASHEAVDPALSLAGQGALVAGQAPDGNFDPGAANALVARGGRAGVPAELAQLLSERWSA